MKQYHDLLNTILEKGTYKEAARENMPGTISLFGYQFRHNLQEGFPLLTTKKMFWKGVVVELLWFLRGNTNIKYLVDCGVNIWNEDAYNYYCKPEISGPMSEENKDILIKDFHGYPIPMGDDDDGHYYRKLTFNEFVDLIKNTPKDSLENNLPKYKNYTLGDCGYQYGKMWRDWHTVDLNMDPKENGDSYHKHIDQIQNVINSLKSNPLGRRHIVTAWDPAHDNDLALTWCHALFQFNCRPLSFEQRLYYYENGPFFKITETEITHEALDELKIPKYILDCQLYQRSADVFLGVPFNIASYALLTHIIAQLCNMLPGDFVHTFGDVHIYDNHHDAVREQLSRTPTALPQLIFDISMVSDHNILLDISNVQWWIADMFKIINYNPAGPIKAELSTGMKK